jgi:hypothetical protein
MSSNIETQSQGNRKFSDQAREARRAPPARGLASGNAAPPNPGRGVDPYNTSGVFDRKQAWARVGKR